MTSHPVAKLLIDPETAVVATPDIQESAGCDAKAAWRFPLGAMSSTVTAAMGKFSLTETQLEQLIAVARLRTGTTVPTAA